jgi:hypothetical protein
MRRHRLDPIYSAAEKKLRPTGVIEVNTGPGSRVRPTEYATPVAERNVS